MCCECGPRQVTGGAKGSECRCGQSFRRFHSSEEERERLESYKQQLSKELVGVEERLSELKQR